MLHISHSYLYRLLSFRLNLTFFSPKFIIHCRPLRLIILYLFTLLCFNLSSSTSSLHFHLAIMLSRFISQLPQINLALLHLHLHLNFIFIFILIGYYGPSKKGPYRLFILLLTSLTSTSHCHNLYAYLYMTYS